VETPLFVLLSTDARHLGQWQKARLMALASTMRTNLNKTIPAIQQKKTISGR